LSVTASVEAVAVMTSFPLLPLIVRVSTFVGVMSSSASLLRLTSPGALTAMVSTALEPVTTIYSDRS